MEQESREIVWSGKSPGWRRGARCQTAEGVSEGGTHSGLGRGAKELVFQKPVKGQLLERRWWLTMTKGYRKVNYDKTEHSALDFHH